MSEYQYYEFQSVDRRLTQSEQEAISKLSSRAQISSSKAIFVYNYGDLPGNEKQLLVKYFDAMFYIANWGSLQLMFRFPKGLIDIEMMRQYCVEDIVEVSEINDFVILEISINEEEGFDGWIEGEGSLSSLIGLRQEILQGDYRLLYLAWLKGITYLDELDDEDEDDDEENEDDENDEEGLEPPVPPNFGKLSSSLQAFIDIFEVDEHLLKAAISASVAKPSIPESSIKEAIKKLERSEVDTFLMRLLKGESNLSIELSKKLSGMIEVRQEENPNKRTIRQLLASAEKEEKKEEERRGQEAKAARIRDLEALAKRETAAWEDIDALIQKGTSSSYDEVVLLLLKLQDLADYQNQTVKFFTRVQQLHNKYSSRSGLKRRLLKANLL
ncbi:MAG: hypothetical protein JGK38_21450 [Microcoleus sp. PH2017_15_JOR_U_A]|uniref:hypothetical protein n=1 Tax=unclassified Microcoleus TaxID=2642155 RepID=UPI001DA7B22D|nr:MULTISPECIES: hypothetical protein [unclassified Microcoleus]MCC3474710.1 hypothetical protein [Microcoleus sp. PH2017_13_LAR_U_A]MCC3487211.1 hypothetical protein [Microcoleus sp. PH2017_14_LAR_D_A]MCC3499135.1 hypothetical protein [Microcoleus sp. PH2017_15_JOR_U_A]MCC3600379.1 hypothetical protein [Microcoleus sp. PH2017_26_ELK_O_A]MCC3625353.1 hypothetical protein [Microcoleus sp. PH2017_36_ELK_O_B]